MGTISAKINGLQHQLQKTDINAHPKSSREIQKLNNLESQAWLYKGILERLGDNPSTNHESIAKTLEALEYKRVEILKVLEPRRPKKYTILAGIQDSTRQFLASQAEKDYEQLEKITTNLVTFANSRKPSQKILSEITNKLADQISQSAGQISPYRLRLAYKIDELIRAISSRLVLDSNNAQTDSQYQSLINELRSRISLLSGQFNGLLHNRQRGELEVKKRLQEINNLTHNISDLHRAISNRDADMAVLQRNSDNLVQLNRTKQTQIDSLLNSIHELQINVQNSTNSGRKSQAQISSLQSQLAQLIQEKSNLQDEIRNVSQYARKKELETTELESSKSQLQHQKAELQQHYQEVFDRYQQQKNEIADLKKELEDLQKANQAKIRKFVANLKLDIKPSETRRNISEEDWKNISNQSDYQHVTGHLRSGKWINPYYRRRAKRRKRSN